MPVRDEQTTRAVRRVRRTLDDAHASLARARVLALCSGGIDSCVLVELLAALPTGAAPAQVDVLFVDHGLRSTGETGPELAAARAVADVHGCAVHVRRARPGELAAGVMGVQAAARQWRYAQAAEVACALDCDVVATGHTADDQLECGLLGLIGATPGLNAGMDVVREFGNGTPPVLRLVRPMLGVSRSVVEQVAIERGIEHAEDPSNADPDAYLRNAVRHRVVPSLLDVHPAAGAAVARRVARVREQATALEELAEHALADVSSGPHADVRGLALLRPAARRAVLAAWLHRELEPHLPPRSIDARLVRAVDALAVRPGRAACARIDVAGGACVRRTGYDLVITSPCLPDRS